MKSIYHCFSNDPYNAMDDSYPYSPRWSSNEMANRARLLSIIQLNLY